MTSGARHPTTLPRQAMTALPATCYDVHWYGPYPLEALPELASDPNLVLYMITGTHGLYGSHVPLYLGMTEQSVPERLAQHQHWLTLEQDPPQVYMAAIGVMNSWAELSLPERQAYPPPERSVILAVEGLEILAHQLVYNQQAKQGRTHPGRHFTVFNTGKRGKLYPEVSTLRWYGDLPPGCKAD